MKKVFCFFLSFILIILLLSSCKKTYTCECICTDGVGTTKTFLWETEKLRKKDAITECEEYFVLGWKTCDCNLK